MVESKGLIIDRMGRLKRDKRFKTIFYRNQPERSKREDLDCFNCIEKKMIEGLINKVENKDPLDSGDIFKTSLEVDAFYRNLNNSKMRCSEHGG